MPCSCARAGAAPPKLGQVLRVRSQVQVDRWLWRSRWPGAVSVMYHLCRSIVPPTGNAARGNPLAVRQQQTLVPAHTCPHDVSPRLAPRRALPVHSAVLSVASGALRDFFDSQTAQQANGNGNGIHHGLASAAHLGSLYHLSSSGVNLDVSG